MDKKLFKNILFWKNTVERELEQDIKHDVLPALSALTIKKPSNGVLLLLERILPLKTQPENIGHFTPNEQVCSTCSNYENFVDFIVKNSDGINIPTIKIIQENFPIITTREIQKYKKQMAEDGLLIRRTPTTYCLNPEKK